MKNLLSFFSLRYGQWQIRNGNVEKGIATLQKAISINPEYPFLYMHLAGSLAKLERVAEARENMTTAIRLFPQNPTFHLFMGKILLDAAQYEESMAYINTSVTLDSHNQLAWGYLALVNLGMGNLKKFHSILDEHGISENSDLQIRMILLLEKTIRKWNIS